MGIEISHLRRQFGAFVALDDVGLTIGDGEFIAVLGPSGSGKTSLLRILAGLDQPDAGSVFRDGEDLLALDARRRGVGLVFQHYALFPHMTVAQNVAFGLRVRPWRVRPKAAAIKAKVEHLLRQVELEGLADRYPSQLSGGQRQRVALARAIVFEPRIVLMDEPLSALDKGLREHMQIELRALHRRLGMTTIYVTHDQREAITMSDRIAVMNAGRIEQLDKPETLYAAPKTQFVAGFIGESNFIPVECRNGSVWYEDRRIQTAGAPPAAGRHLMVVRPEKLRLVTAAEPSDGINVLDATLSDIIYQGDSFVCYASLRDGRQLTLRDYCRSDVLSRLPAPGQPVRLGLDAKDTILVEAEG